MHAFPFLQRLGLDQVADERAVKRAYARELKQIDQERDAAGFQALRQAYEMALEWVRGKPAASASAGAPSISFAPLATVPVAPVVVPQLVPELTLRRRAASPVSTAPARDADTSDSPAQLAQAVFEDLRAAGLQLVAQGQVRDGEAWRRQLQACLDDERLLNISARAHFEFHVARLLADGWKSGHESLFVAARQVFGWEKDRRRLAEFGQLGAWLNQAIDEWEMYGNQQSGECDRQAAAILRLREAAEPTRRELVTHVPHLRNMAARFPAWTSIIASTERIEQWMALEHDLPEWRKKHGVEPPDEKRGGWWKFSLVLFAAFIFAVLVWPADRQRDAPMAPFTQTIPLTAQQQAAEDAYQRAAGSLYMKPGTRTLDGSRYAADQSTLPPRLQYDALPPTPAQPRKPSGRAPNAAERKVIGDRIQFEWSHVENKMYKVEVMVDLDDHGGIKKITKKTGSGLAVLDRNVEEAIRASAPFKPEISRRFGLVYSWGRIAQKTPASTTRQAAPAGEPAPPADT